MNANKTMTAVSTIAVAVTALTAAMPAAAGDHRDRDFRRGERVVVTRHAPPPRVVVVQRPVYQQRPVVVERRVVVHRPAPVYHRQPAYAYAPAPVYHDRRYDQRAAYRDDDSNPAGAVAGAVIGGVIGSQVGDHETRGVTTVIGAILGGLIGNGF